jgi:ABC-2 type transport system permease protein
MLRYIKLYKTLIVMNFSLLSAYRANFVNSAMSSVTWGLFSFLTIFLLTSKTNTLYGWSRDEILVLTGVYNIMIGLFHTLFSRNFGRFSRIVHLGELDSILVKPIDSQYLLSFWLINYTSIFRIILGIIFTFYILGKTGAEFSHFSLIISSVVFVFSIITLYSIWYLVLTLIIWFTKLDNLLEILFDINGVSRFPQEMYKGISEYVFLFLLPLTLIVVTPSQILLSKMQLPNIFLLIIFSMLLFVSSRKFWKFALRYYTSASS